MMESPIMIFVFALLPSICLSAVFLRPISNINVPFQYEEDEVTGIFGIDSGAVKQSAYDIDSGLVYIAGNRLIHIVDYSNATNPVILDTIMSESPFIHTDVGQCGSRVAFAASGIATQPGDIHLFSLYDSVPGPGRFLYRTSLKVGYNPDMLQFTKDCNTLVVANEGSPVELPTTVFDPKGSVSIIKFSKMAPPLVTTLNFDAFNDRMEAYASNGLHLHYQGKLGSQKSILSQMLEPEHVTFNQDETKAYISLQENNAIAEVNLQTQTIDEIYPLGVKSWKNLSLDASNEDSGINLASYDIASFYQPDNIYHFEFNGIGYIATANEGDTTKLAIDGRAGGDDWSDAKSGSQLLNDGQISADINEDLIVALRDDRRLGVLEFSTVDGLDIEDPTKISKLHFFGGRGISIFRSDDMSLVWDSGDMIARLHSEAYPKTFNAKSKPNAPDVDTPEDLVDDGSPNQGAECQALEMGELEDGTRLLFVGVGGSSSIVTLSLTTSTTLPELKIESVLRDGGTDQPFSDLLENGNIGTLDPSNLRFIPSRYSSTGNPLLLVTSTTSGNLAMYEVMQEESLTTPKKSLTTLKGSLTTPKGSGHGIHTAASIVMTFGFTIGLYLAIWG